MRKNNESSKTPRFFDKRVSLVCLGIMAVSAIVVFLLLFLPLVRIADSASTSASEDGTYVGWQIAFYYWGKRFQQGTYYFGFNPMLTLGVIIPLVALLFAGLMWRKAGRLKRSVLLFIVAASLLFCGIVYINALGLCYNTASPDMKLIMFYAMEKGTGYDLLAYPIVDLAVCIIAALSLTGAGVTNLIKK